MVVARGDVAAARVLVAAGASADVKNEDKLTPRMLAEQRGDAALLGLLR